MTYSLTLDLDTLFKGGATSPALQQRLNVLKEQMHSYQQLVEAWKVEETTTNTLLSLVYAAQDISDGVAQCFSFVNALVSADTNDTKAKTILGDIFALFPIYQLSETMFSKKLTNIETQQWLDLLESKEIQELRFRLEEIRHDGKKLLSNKEENIINTLSLDGINAWSSHYDTIVATIEIPDIDEAGNVVMLSAGQASIKMMSDPDNDTRKRLFLAWEKAWQEKAPLFADTLNHIDGFRLATYRLHNTTDFLEYPLQYNRMQEKTLQVMWDTIDKNKEKFLQYFARKAKLLGKDTMEWQDQDAPVALGTLTEKNYTFDEGAAFIIQNFEKFSHKMAAFAKMAFEKSWIEAENRPGKRPGGYCTGLPEAKESRIFMTYGNSMSSVSTLAHELGHAFHSSVLWQQPSLNRDYAMNVAETASTFAELIVSDAALQQVTSTTEKINLLDVKLQNATAMFLNIHARFIFERSFYEARQKGIVPTEQMTEMMLNAQKESYQNSLATYHPHFWASKLHFFIDDVPFYNFPYTFGYLFSLGIYAYANKKGSTFEDDYIALLQDTAIMTTEELAMKHLHVDLTKADFWQAGIDMILQDVTTFLTLSEEYSK
jgi:pepF/M3 family oligoendopeptidase